MKSLLLLLSLLLLPLAGCRQAAVPTSNLPTLTMTIGSKTYTLEIAATVADRNKGLMYRDAMAADHGMIFCFAQPAPLNFWMRNTRIPLDILYLDASGKIVSIQRMEPYVERGTPSKSDAQFAIELNAGQAQQAGVKEGDTLQIPDAAKTTRADP